MKSLSAVLLILLVLGSQDQFVKVPLNDPLNSFTGPPIEVTKISGKLLGTIADGDFVHPTFSPDANTLAYARVLTPANTENTEVLLRRVSDGQKTVLFSSSKAWKYATYNRPLTKIATSGHASLEVKYQSTERVVFQIIVRAPYERGDNPLFVFDGSLRRINEYQELHDVDFDRAGRRVAFCYWNGNQRNISIKELN